MPVYFEQLKFNKGTPGTTCVIYFQFLNSIQLQKLCFTKTYSSLEKVYFFNTDMLYGVKEDSFYILNFICEVAHHIST